VRVRWRGMPLRLVCRNDAVHAEAERSLTVTVAGRDHRVGPAGRWFG